MKHALLLGLLFIWLACKKNGNSPGSQTLPPPPPPPPPIGNLAITGTSPEFTFWGDTLTLTGTGFSSNKTDNYVWVAGVLAGSCLPNDRNDSTGWRKAEVVSATSTELKIKVPYVLVKQNNGDERPCGDDIGVARVSVKGKYAVSPQIKMIAIPTLNEFHFQSLPYAIAPGADAILLTSTGLHLQTSGYADKVRITAGGSPLSIVPYTSTNFKGYRFVLPPKDFVRMICSPNDPTYGAPGRQVPFRIYIDGKDKGSVSNYFVFNLHSTQTADPAGSFTFSKSTSGPNAQITIKGKNMFYNIAKFISGAGCPTATINITPCHGCDQLIVVIPLSQMNAGCTYSVRLEDACGRFKLVGGVTITN